MGILPDTSSPTNQPEQERRSSRDRRKRRSAIDDLRQIKKIVDNIRTYGKLITNPGVIAGLVILVIIIIFFLQPSGSFFGGGGGENTETPGDSIPSVPSIPGFNIDIEGPTTAPNGVDLEYRVVISHEPTVAPPIENIEIYDSMPSGSSLVSTTGELESANASPNVWPLSKPVNQRGFSILVRPNKTDINFEYTISARQIAGTGGSSGNACTQPYEGTGYCSVDNLAPTFAGDRGKALTASMICQAESSSNPFAINTACNSSSNDYSIGLFQINLVVHCPGAYANSDCTQLLDADTRAVCEAPLKDPIENIQKMYALSTGTYWVPWATWPGVESKLESCGIL